MQLHIRIIFQNIHLRYQHRTTKVIHKDMLRHTAGILKNGQTSDKFALGL